LSSLSVNFDQHNVGYAGVDPRRGDLNLAS